MAIDKGIPIPPRNVNDSATQRNEARSMKPGDSMFFSKVGSMASLRTLLRYEHPEWTFVSRKVEGGHRLWRVT